MLKKQIKTILSLGNKKWYQYLVHFLAGIGVAGFIFLYGCAPLKRHDRIVKKYPFVHQSDTILIRDTVRLVVPEVHVDTFVVESMLYDTITITKENLQVKLYKVKGKGDTIYVDGKSKEIVVTKYLEKKVPVTVYKKDIDKIHKYMLWFVLLCILFLLLTAFFRKRDEK